MKKIEPATSLAAAKRLSRQAEDLYAAAYTLEFYDARPSAVEHLREWAHRLSNASEKYYDDRGKKGNV